MYKSLTTILNEPVHESYIIPDYKTGYPSLDYCLGGISNSDLVLIEAKAGNWGNNLMLNFAAGLSKRYHVLLISSAKSASATAKELKSVLLPNDDHRENDDDVLNELNRLAANIFIEDEAWFLDKIDKAITNFRSEYRDDAIILIDQLNSIFLSKEIRTSSKDREERDISVNLKMLTLKYQIPVLILATFKSPEPVNEKDPPGFWDLKHLVELHCPFNKIIGVHRPEYYRIETDEKGASTENKLFLNILKNDSGKRGIIRLNFSESNRFRLTDEIQNQFE